MGERVVGATGREALEVAEVAGFEEFFLRERPRLLGSMVLVVGNALEAEEIVQEAFVRLWERWDRVGAMDDPTGYLYRTAFNVQRSAYRRALRAARRTLSLGTGPDPYATVAGREAIVRALGTMTPRERAAVILTELDGYTAEETAMIMGIRPGTVYVLVSKGRKALHASTEVDDA
jgi:RNA polymerase sigma-70 factor, ECF subfamily